MITNEYYDDLDFEQKAFLVRLNEDIQETFQENLYLNNIYEDIKTLKITTKLSKRPTQVLANDYTKTTKDLT
jgi:hypothetical protein